jgi:hypothetical protein
LGDAAPMVRKSRYNHNAFRPVDAATWLVVRDRCSLLLEYRPLAPNADLRAVLNSERAKRVAAGWVADEIGIGCYFFCSKDGVRVFVGIAHQNPNLPQGNLHGPDQCRRN